MDIEVLVHTLKDGIPALAVTALSTILSATLTIIGSDFWQPLVVPNGCNVSADISSWFNATTSDVGTAGDSAYVSVLILATNLSYP